MNLLADYVEGLTVQLTSEGVSLNATEAKTNSSDFLATYIEYDRRRIAPASRGVKFSKQLENSPEWAKHQAAIGHLAELTRRGEPLIPYQSKQVGSLNQRDLLLSDWNIHHLHLGAHAAKTKFAARTGPLLYATFLSKEAYFIAVMDHSSFSELELLEIIDGNWPSYLDRFTFKDVLEVFPVPSSSDVKKLRRAGVQTVVPLRSGRFLFPPGGGYSTAGTSIASMLEAQRIARRLRDAEAYILTHEANIRHGLGIASGDPIRLAALEQHRVVLTRDDAQVFFPVPIGG